MNWQKIKNPVKRFWLILYFSARRHIADSNAQRAVTLTYYTVFSVVPMAALIFGIAKGFDLDSKLREIINEKLWQHQTLLDKIAQFADSTLNQTKGSVIAGIGVITLIWTVMWLSNNIEKSFNAVWQLPARRNIFRRFSDYMAILLLTPVIMVVMSSSGVFFRSKLAKVAASMPFLCNEAEIFFSLLASLISILLVCLIFSLIYYLVPNTRVKIVPALMAGLVAGILFQTFQDAFVLLQGSIFRYNRIYGSFAALPLFLIWLQWSWEIVLFGAEFGFVAQHLDYGLFGNIQPQSIRHRRIYQLTIAREIFNRLGRNEGATSWEQLRKAIPAAPVILENELDFLIRSGVICQVADSRNQLQYLPSKPGDFSLEACSILLDSYGNNEPSGSSAEAEMTEIFERFEQQLLNSENNQPLQNQHQA